MKKGRIIAFFGIILVLSFILNSSLVLSAEYFFENINILEMNLDQKIKYPYPFIETTSGEVDEKMENEMVSSMNFAAAVVPSITLLWPEAGYYYSQDFMLLWIETDLESNCTYNLDGTGEVLLGDINGTDHSEYIYDLADNMNAGPYEVIFNCIDQFGSSSQIDTYFWINHSEINKYFIRHDIGSWEYLISSEEWSGNDEGLLGYYEAFYGIEEEFKYDRIQIYIFENPTALQNYIQDDFLDNSELEVNIETFDNYNIYRFDYNSMKYAIWTTGNTLVASRTYLFGNETAIEIEIPEEIIREYMGKYPSDLKDGICGDGNIDVNNYDGIAEECDGNYEEISCGSNVGECEAGVERRECDPDCTWGEWAECDAVVPVDEVCDGLDNDCDGTNDENFTNLGEGCSVGIGECASNGEYVCSIDTLFTECNVVATDPIEEICTDSLDNDCDGLIDFEDFEDCIPLTILSPLFDEVYSDRKVVFDLFIGTEVDEISYQDLEDARPRSRRLCRSCDEYNRSRSLKDGIHNILFQAFFGGEILDEKNVSFIVDSKAPRISKTEPRNNALTNGEGFYIKLREDNPREIKINFTEEIVVDLQDCEESRGYYECYTDIDLADYDGEYIEYYFTVEDIAGNVVSSKPTKVKVDTTGPTLNNPDSFWEQGDGRYQRYIYFDFNVTEENFDQISYSYIDSRGRERERRICSRLRDGKCETKKSFRSGEYNLMINIKDDAGNVVSEEISFVVG